jgi:hypothetical protein
LRNVVPKKMFRTTDKKGYCFIVTMLDPLQPEQSKREFSNYSGNFLSPDLAPQ